MSRPAAVPGTVRAEVLRETPRGPAVSTPSPAALRDLLAHVERGLVTAPDGRPMHARVIVWLTAEPPAEVDPPVESTATAPPRREAA